MSEKIFKFNPRMKDFERLILQKQQFAEWAGTNRHNFKYYLNPETPAGLTERQRKLLVKELNVYMDEVYDFCRRLML